MLAGNSLSHARPERWGYVALARRELAHAKIAGQTSAGGLTELAIVPLAEEHILTIPAYQLLKHAKPVS